MTEVITHLEVGPSARCRWAIRFGVTLVTRCFKPDGHLGNIDPPNGENRKHEGKGLEQFDYQRIVWFPGDRREFTTLRTDEYAWESE